MTVKARLFDASRMLVIAVVALTLASCSIVSGGAETVNDDRASLHEGVRVAVSTAVPEAIDVGVTTSRDGLSNALSIRIDVADPSMVSADLVDRAMRAAWQVDEGQSSYVRLRVRHEGEPLHLGEIMAEMDLGSGDNRNIEVSREVLESRYGSP